MMRLGHPATAANDILWIQQLKMAAAAILKNRKNLNIFATDWPICRNLACWCVLTLSAAIANKISLFQKIQDGGNGHFENSKNCNISTTRRPILTTFSTMMNLCLPDSVDMVANCHMENIKKHDISKIIRTQCTLSIVSAHVLLQHVDHVRQFHMSRL